MSKEYQKEKEKWIQQGRKEMLEKVKGIMDVIHFKKTGLILKKCEDTNCLFEHFNKCLDNLDSPPGEEAVSGQPGPRQIKADTNNHRGGHIEE